MIKLYTGPVLPRCYLPLIIPDFGDKVKIRYKLPSEQAEGLTGIEHRTPKAIDIRHEMEITYQLTQDELTDFKETLAVIAGDRIAMPVWCDAFGWQADWIHDGAVQVGWSPDDDAYSITTSGHDMSEFQFAAPVLLGRIKRPTFKYLGGHLYSTTVTFTEDSDSAFRVTFRSGTVPTVFEWEPDYFTIKDSSRDQVRLIELGGGREVGVAGADGTNRWAQSAEIQFGSRLEILGFCRFWLAHIGSVKSFTAPVWCEPDTASAAVPELLTARFGKDQIEVVFTTPEVAACEIELVQEVATATSQDGNIRTRLYLLTWENHTPLAVTSFERAITLDGTVYSPARISQDEFRDTISPLGAEVDIEYFEGDSANPFRPIIQGDSERRLTAKIIAVRLSPSTGAVIASEIEFEGDIRSAELGEDTIKGKAATLGGMFQRRFLRHVIQPRCNYFLGDAGCKLASSAITSAGVLTGDFPTQSPWFTPSTAPSSGSYKSTWFNFGWIEVYGSDGNFHRRAILDGFVGSDGVYTLKLNRPLPATCAGRAVTAWAGCDGNHTTCKLKWGNKINFGGFPFTPSYISTSNGTAQKTGK